jgi:hypothetical protein
MIGMDVHLVERPARSADMRVLALTLYGVEPRAVLSGP